MAISALAEDNESELAAPKKSKSCKANPNRCRKRPRLKLIAGTFMENSNSELVVHKRWLAKGRHNLSTHEPTLVNNSGTREITADNSKLL